MGEKLTKAKMVNMMQLNGLPLFHYTKIPTIPLDLHLDSMLRLLLTHSPFSMSCLNELGLATREAYEEVCEFLQGKRLITECH